jgi:hypothetical protein
MFWQTYIHIYVPTYISLHVWPTLLSMVRIKEEKSLCLERKQRELLFYCSCSSFSYENKFNEQSLQNLLYLCQLITDFIARGNSRVFIFWVTATEIWHYRLVRLQMYTCHLYILGRPICARFRQACIGSRPHAYDIRLTAIYWIFQSAPIFNACNFGKKTVMALRILSRI